MVISLMFTLHIGLQNRKGGIIMLKKKDNNKKETNKLEKIIHKINIFNKLNKKEKKRFNPKELLNKINIFKKIRMSETFSYKEVIAIVIFSMAIGGLCVFSLMNVFTNGNYITLTKDFNKLIKTYNTITSQYYGEVDKQELIDNAIAGMLATVSDPYTTYIDTETTESFLERVNGTYNGIGCEVYVDNDKNITIGNVFDNSPASKAGLQKGDIILEVDEKNYEGKTATDVSNYIKKTNDTIKLKVKRNDEILNIKLKPKKVEIPSVSTEIYERNNKKIGYMYISIFSSVTDTQFNKKIKELEKEGITALVIDVRQNTGGYLDVVTNMLDIILPKGKIIYQLEDKTGTTKKYSTSERKKEYPIAVLVDNVSASASEILASSIKESYGGYVVGINTYGKGTVQQTFDLDDGSMIKYTTQKWLTPDGNWINEVGVEPTNKVELKEDYYNNPTTDNDNQLQTALDLVSK